MTPVFAMTYCDSDRELAAQTLREIRKHYPKSPILTFDDSLQPLKRPECGGLWSERYLKGFLATDSELLLKIDPDTECLSGCEVFPEGDLFGRFAEVQRPLCVLGGVFGIRRSAAQRITDSGLLRDPRYCGTGKAGDWWSYRRYQAPYVKQGEALSDEAVSCQDRITADVAFRLGLTLTEWDAIWCQIGTAPIPDGDWKFIHPREALKGIL